MKQADTAVLEEKIGYAFSNRELLDQALTHSSHAREQATVNDNEQLEFLGDSVLGFITSQELFRRFPEFTEGELSKLRARLVSARHLARIAKELDLGAYLRLGRGEEKSGGRAKSALLVDALEALVAALFLEAGLERARLFVLDHLIGPELDRFEDGLEPPSSEDYKSELQERLHACGHSEPHYVVIAEAGPEHKKVFTMEIRLVDLSGQEFAARGQGTTKKRAGQAAAREALIHMDSVASPPNASSGATVEHPSQGAAGMDDAKGKEPKSESQ
jgi:ribonuclease-3